MSMLLGRWILRWSRHWQHGCCHPSWPHKSVIKFACRTFNCFLMNEGAKIILHSSCISYASVRAAKGATSRTRCIFRFFSFFAMQYPGNRAKNCIFPGAKNLIISVSLICLRLKLKKNCGPFKYSLDRSNSYGKHSTFCRLSLCSVHKWIDFTGKGLRTREIYSNNWKKKKEISVTFE